MPLKRPIEEMMDLSYDAHMTNDLVSTKNTILESCACKKPKLDFYGGTTFLGSRTISHQQTVSNLVATTNNLLNYRSSITTSNVHGGDVTDSTNWKRPKLRDHPLLTPTHLTTENRILHQDYKKLKLNQELRDKCSYSLSSLTLNDEEKVFKDTYVSEKHEEEITSPECDKIQADIPQYHFPSLEVSVPSRRSQSFTDEKTTLLKQKLEAEKSAKMTLLTIVSTSLMQSPNFKKANDPVRLALTKSVEKIAEFDPEFILKTVLYAREELNLRQTSNFLLALAAFNPKTRIFLQKYFTKCIRLPTDWMKVAELYQVFSDSNLKPGSLPAALRRAMREAFVEFDEYQLAKYNKKKKKKKEEKKKKDKDSDDDSDDEEAIVSEEDEEITEQKAFTLKRLIRLLHISKPAEHVMGLLGKKYPSDRDSFRTSGLPGVWNEELAGKRMKLRVPETWETQIALHGPKAWAKLIDNGKLPYMAMLRNIRNLLLAGITESHHKKVISTLADEKRVIKSRQFPLRFFTAYNVLGDLRKLRQDEGFQNMTPKREEIWVKKWKRKLTEKLYNFTIDQVDEYKKSVDKAVEIATVHNLQPIQGRTLIMCDVRSGYYTDCKLMKHALAEGTGARLSHAAVLLGAMCLSVCENGEMVIFPAKDSAYKYVNLEGKSILEKTQKIIDNYVPQGYFSETLENQLKFLGTYLDSFELRDNMQYLDTVVLLTHGKNCLLNDIPNLVNKFLCKYRAFVNPNLLFVLVDLNGTKCDFGDMHLSQDNVFLSGFSDQILKFLAERGSGAQLAYVEDIDIKYNLKPLPNHVLKTLHQPSSASESSIVSLLPKAPKWKTVKVFVSSTFRDMNSERDILTKYVFPELKRRASAFHINICEVDLRWGITEKEAAEESLLSTCLSEVKRCELFVGIIGSRYGRTPSRYVAPDDPEFDWVREFPPGASITEMEIYCAALNHPEESKERTFFYFRDSSFEKDIPPKWLDHFCSESPYHAEKVRALKDKIRKHGFKIYDGYPCTWIGEVNGIAVVGGLELFGQQVLEDLWNAVQKLYIKDGEDEVDNPYAEHLALAASYKNIVGHEEFINDCIENIENKNGIHIIEGKAGSGKSAILGYLSQKLDDVTFIYFVGLLPGSTNLHELLLQLVKRLCELYSPYSEIFMEKECLKFQLNDILHNVSKHFKDNKLIFIIDGLDNISEDAPEQISWIPYNLPSCVRFVCSVTAGSAVAKLLHEQEMALEEKLHLYPLEPLKVPERKEMISLELAPYGKALDENPFNNQLSILATKRDAGIPLYLRLACEKLRSFGFMEQLTNMLRILPKSIPLLLQSVLKKMEDEHGEAIIQHSLCILALSPEGLEEHELHFVLSKIMNVNDKNSISKIEDAIPPVRFAHLMCSLRMFLNPGTDKGNKMIILTHKEVTKAVEIRYMQSLKKDKRSMYHKVLADYFHADADPLGDLSWKSQNARSFRGLLFHLIQGHFFVELAEVLCDLSFIQSALSIGIGFTLLDIYLAAQRHLAQMKKSPVFTFKGWKNTKATNLEQAANKIEEYFNFLLKNMDILQKTPHIVWQQARLQFDSDQIRQESLSLNEYSGFECSSKLPGQSPVWKLTKFAKTILCLAISPDEKLCALGDQAGVIWLVDLNNSKLLKTFANHTSAVTGITFVGRDMLCSVSKDCQLVFCKISNEDRIIKSNAHSRPITCCCSDPGGTIVVTGSWDRTIRVWNVRDFREISCINKNNCPVSCIVFHPSRQIVISGGWDKKIKLWDLQSLKRIAVLSGHKASVRSIVITPCGNIIASASSSGEVFLWSATSGHRIGTLKGHVSTVNCVSISPKGSYLATASSDLTIKMWRYNDENSGRMENMKLSKHHTHSAYISLDLLALAGRDSVQILDTENNRVEFTKTVDDVEITCMEALYSSDTPSYVSAIVYGTREGTVEKMYHQGQPNAYRIYKGKSPISVVKNIQNWIIAGTESGNIFVINIHDEREMFSAIAHKGRVLICSDAKGHSSGSKSRHVSISFVTVGDDQHLAVWNLGKATTGNPWELSEVANLTSLHANKITACAASIHDDVLVTASSDTTVKMWTKFCTDERSAKVLDGLDAPIINMEIKGNFIFAGTKNGSIRIWTLVGYKVAKVLSNDSYESISTITFKYFAGPECLEKYGTEVYALIGIFDNYGSCVVKKPFERREYFSLEGHGHPVVSCALTKNADRLLSSSLDNSVCLWKTCVGNDVSLADSSSRHKRKVTHVDFATSAPLALSADDAGTIIIWKCENEELEFVYSWTIPNSTIKSASFYTSDGQQLLIGSVTKHGMCEISIYTNHSTQNDPSCWKFRKTCWEKLNSEITFVLHSTSSNRIFVFDTENIVTGFDRKLSKLDNKRSLMEDWVMNAVFDPYDDDKILVTYATGSIKTYCWTQRRWEISVQYKEGEDINLSKVFEDEQLHSPTVLTTTKLVESESSGESQQFMILIGDSIGYLTIKRGTGLASTFETKKIHDAAIVNLVPIKNLLFSSSKDNTVKVWDLRSLKQVGIFRSDVAITSLACTNWNSAHDCKGDTPLSTVLLMLGTMTGHVQILKWTYRLSE